MLGKVDWVWFAAGILFVMFILPFLMNLLGKIKGRKAVA
jgi:hypothetical protein